MDLDAVALADPDLDRARSLGREFGVPSTASSLEEVLPVSLLRQVGVAAVQTPARLYAPIKPERFERMQCVVMDEDRDRSLSGQEMSGMLDHRGQAGR